MNRHPAYHGAYYYAATRPTFVAPSTGQLARPFAVDPPQPPQPPSPSPTQQTELREQRLFAQIAAGFRDVTWSLILTGVAIGFASAIGNALGALVVDRYIQPKRR